MTQHQIAWDQNSSPWKTMSVTDAIVVRLMALSGSESEISPPRSQVHVFQLDRCRHQFLRGGEYGLVRASTKHLGAVAKALGCRFRSWRSRHASGLVDKPSFDRVRHTTADGIKVYNEGQRKLDVCTLDGQQRRSMTFKVARVKKGSGISKPNAEEREQACV